MSFFFKQIVQDKFELTYVTQATLKLSADNYNLTSGKIELSLEVQNAMWQLMETLDDKSLVLTEVNE